ncbi:MAPEG family protein [Burkholderia sp. Ac-20353]|nr:MAPEG family protein [Burkholderia sp. Ac-20353]
MHMNHIALVCTAILGLLLFGLGLAVSIARFRATTGSGCAEDPTNPLHKLVRAHGNTAEYAPFLALLFLYFGAHEPSRAILSLIVAATACRCLLVAGLLVWPTMARPNPARFVGALGTYLCGAALCIALVA